MVDDFSRRSHLTVALIVNSYNSGSGTWVCTRLNHVGLSIERTDHLITDYHSKWCGSFGMRSNE